MFLIPRSLAAGLFRFNRVQGLPWGLIPFILDFMKGLCKSAVHLEPITDTRSRWSFLEFTWGGRINDLGENVYILYLAKMVRDSGLLLL